MTGAVLSDQRSHPTGTWRLLKIQQAMDLRCISCKCVLILYDLRNVHVSYVSFIYTLRRLRLDLWLCAIPYIIKHITFQIVCPKEGIKLFFL